MAAQSIKYFFASVIRGIAQTAALSLALSRFVPVLLIRCLAPKTKALASGFLYLDNIYQNTPSPLTREVGSLMFFSEVDAR